MACKIEWTDTCIQGVEGGVLCDNQQQVQGQAAIDDDAWREEGLCLHRAVHSPLLALAKRGFGKDAAVQFC